MSAVVADAEHGGARGDETKTALLTAGEPEEQEVAHEKRASWQTVGLLQVGDIVGTGVLALGSAVAQVGYAPAAIMLPLFLLFNVYAGVVLQEVFLVFPAATNFAKMARLTSGGNKPFTLLVSALYHAFLLSILAQYVQVLGFSLKAIFINAQLCNYVFVAIGCAILLPLAQGRTLNDTRSLMYINTISITLCVLISLGYMLLFMGESTAQTYAFNRDATFSGVVSAVLKLCFAFSGNFIYPEMLAEMERPAEFYKAFWISSPYQIVVYSLAAFVQFSYEGASAGNNGMIFKAIPVSNPLYGISFLISSSIPSFFALMDLLASFMVAPLGFIIPPIFVLLTRRSVSVPSSWHSKLALGSTMLLGAVLTVVGVVLSIQGAAESFRNGEPPFHC